MEEGRGGRRGEVGGGEGVAGKKGEGGGGVVGYLEEGSFFFIQGL